MCGQVKGTGHVIEVVTALGNGRVTALVTFLFQFISDNYITHLHPSIASQYYCSVVERSWATLRYTATLARFKRRFEVKIKYAPPFKMFLFISREASEKKFPKK